MEKWLDKLQDGAQFDGLTNQGFNYNSSWNGSFYSGGGLKGSEDRYPKGKGNTKPYPSVSKGEFAGGGRSYPIPTRADAVDALKLAGLHHRPDVKAKVYSKYPDLKKSQDGEELNKINLDPLIRKQASKQLLEDLSKSKEYQKGWMGSPRYGEMMNISDPKFGAEITKNRLKNVESVTGRLSNTTAPDESGYITMGEYRPSSHKIVMYPEGINNSQVVGHEISHASDRLISNNPYLTEHLSNKEEGSYLIPPSDIEMMKKNLLPYKSIKKGETTYDALDKRKYVENPSETRARLSQIRQKGAESKVYDPYTQNITPENLDIIQKEYSKEGKNMPIEDLINSYGRENTIKMLNSISANTTQNNYSNVAQNGMNFYKAGLDFQPKSISQSGTIIEDDLGQWAHPGSITKINSNNITMEKVPYNVLGVSNTGDTKMMKPNKKYKFKGSTVTEYPQIQNGVELDQITNFTNYNKPTKGGWLDNL